MTTHDPDKIGRFAREHFSSALMSDTKWRKAFAALKAADADLVQMVVKFIDVPEPRIMSFPPKLDDCPRAYMDTIEFGPTELRAIEWLEFPRTAQFERPNNVPARHQEQDIAKAAEAIAALGRYPLEACPEAVRITGYRR